MEGKSRLLIINPNSSLSVTEGLHPLRELAPRESYSLTFYTAPEHAPPAIKDFRTALSTAHACYEELKGAGILSEVDGILVCCFSDHPLTHLLREHYTEFPSPLAPFVTSIFEAGIAHALMVGRRFGVVSTGTGFKPLLSKGVSAYLGANASDRWAGCITTGVAVVELREGDPASVKARVKAGAAAVAKLGADVIVMGCAGMAGMEEVIREGATEGGTPDVKVVDGCKAGLAVLMGLLTVRRTAGSGTGL